MKRKIIEGESISINDFRNYRNVKSDASYGVKGHPNSMMLRELIDGKFEGDYSSFEINTRHGYPNDSLTIKLIDGSSYRDIQNSIKNKHGKVGFVESSIFSLSGPSYNSFYDARVMKTEPLEEMCDERLIQIAFSPFSMSRYGKYIKNHFSDKDNKFGSDLELTIDKWYDDNTNKDLVISFIKDKLYSAYASRRRQIDTIIIPKDLLKILTFSRSIKNLSEFIAMGGIQYVNVNGYLIFEKWGEKSWNSRGEIIETPTQIQVQLDFLLGDWFGVDEDDITNNKLPAQFGRRELAALWVLQHQRGYRPFICFYKYSEILDLKFNITYNN